MATQPPIRLEHLSYDSEDDTFKWKGSVDELKRIVNSTLGIMADGETSEDRAHRAVTYKVSDVSVRLYTSTCKLKLFGANYNLLREGFHKLLNDSPSSPSSPLPEPEPKVSEPSPNIAEILKALVDDVTALKRDVSLIKSQASANAAPGDETDQLQQDLQISRREIEELKAEIKIHKDTICKLQSERDSLVTTINILVADRDEAAPQTMPEQVPTESDQQWQRVARKNKSNKPKTKPKTKETATSSESTTPVTTMVIVGDSIVGKLEGWKMANKQNRVIVNAFPGATADDMMDHINPVIRRKPNRIILHVGTNNLAADEANVITDKIVNVCQHIEHNLPECEIAISELTLRRDSPSLDTIRKEVNKSLKAFCRTRDWSVITHNIQENGLNSRGLHLNHRGTASIARDLNTFIKAAKQ